MLKNISKLEVKIGEKTYQLLCDQDSPLNEAKEAVFQFLKYLGQVEDALRAQQQAAQPEQPSNPEVHTESEQKAS